IADLVSQSQMSQDYHPPANVGFSGGIAQPPPPLPPPLPQQQVFSANPELVSNSAIQPNPAAFSANPYPYYHHGSISSASSLYGSAQYLNNLGTVPMSPRQQFNPNW